MGHHLDGIAKGDFLMALGEAMPFKAYSKVRPVLKGSERFSVRSTDVPQGEAMNLLCRYRSKR
jgi:hypothetical protein